MAHEHSSNEVPKKTFEVKTFVDRRGLPRGSKGAGKKSSKKSKKKGKRGTSSKDWDLEKAWMNDDSDESDGQVRIPLSLINNRMGRVGFCGRVQGVGSDH